MKVYRSQEGPFVERPYYTLQEIDRICGDALRTTDLYPSAPEAIRIERFIEKHFRIQVAYEEMPEGVLGFTLFGQNGVEEVVISRRLAEDDRKSSERRLSATLAHEAGHGLLHAHLFVLETEQVNSLFGDAVAKSAPKVLSREGTVAGSQGFSRGRRYDGRWWEFQANQAIGALLMPKRLVYTALQGLLVERGLFGHQTLERGRMPEAVDRLSRAFDVNPIVAEIRVDGLFGLDNKQLTL